MRPIRLAALAGLVALLGAGPASAAEPECALSVEPKIAVAGTQFVLSGSGYTPNQLILQKDDGPQTTIELDLAGADPFEIPIDSKPGDEGLWTATVSGTDGECSATTAFRVTLRSTAMFDELIAGRPGGPLLPLYLLVLGLGFTLGLLAARRLRLA